jgi:UDP-glucose 4-epimerase
MRILVTGGAGFIGSHLTKRLLETNPTKVVVLDNLHRGCLEALAEVRKRIEFQEADIRDAALLRAAMQGVDVVYHLAAQANVLGAVADMDYSFFTNTVGTYNVLREARHCGVRRVVFTSSREVYGEVARLPVPESAPLNPKNAYGASKAAGELYCRIFGSEPEVVILRLANVYGPNDRDRVIPLFLGHALAGRPLTIFGENKILDFVWVGDVVGALLEAGRRDVAGETINVGSGRGTTLPELAERIVGMTGSASEVQFAEARSVEVDRFVADIQRAQKLLGYMPPVDPLYRLGETLGGGRLSAL